MHWSRGQGQRVFSGLRTPEGQGVTPGHCRKGSCIDFPAKSAGCQHIPQIRVGSCRNSPVEQTDEWRECEHRSVFKYGLIIY